MWRAQPQPAVSPSTRAAQRPDLPGERGGEVLFAAADVEEAVHVAFGEALALGGIGRLPQAVLVFLDRQAGDDHGAAAAVAQAKAELHVCDAVEAKARVE